MTMPRWLRLLLLLGTPLATGTLELFHPRFLTVADARWWLTLHVLQLPMVGLMALVLYVLTDATTGWLRLVSRLAAGVFAVFYGALDAILGIATGSIELMVPTLRPELHDGAEAAIQIVFFSIGNTLIKEVGRYAWLVSVVALAAALARRGKPRAPLVLLVLGGISFWYTHEFPTGALGMYLCFLAVLWLELGPQGRGITARPADHSPRPHDQRTP